jgi:hypothetical protein
LRTGTGERKQYPAANRVAHGGINIVLVPSEG